MLGRIFSIEEFSVYDGPGIRTSVFLKGCPLHCSWCHNPEGQSREREIVRSPNGCIDCKSCTTLAKRERGRLIFTEECIKKCPIGLLRVCGEDIDSESLAEKLLKNAKILNMNGGGVTFSGGEPLLQSEFLFETLKLLLGKVHTAIQTCGYASADTFSQALKLCDYVLYDLKLIDEREHIAHTGVSNALILKNFDALVESGREFVVRIPLIPTVTDSEKNVRLICELLRSRKVDYVELLPYNKMAGGKYKMLMREYAPTFDDTKEVELRCEIFTSYGIKYKVL